MRTRAAVELDLLDGADLVDRARRRPDDGPARLDRQPRHGDRRAPGTRARRSCVISVASCAGSARVVLGGVGDAEAAAEVQLGQRRRRARRRSGRAAPAPGGRRPRSRTVSKIWVPMWRVQAEQVEARGGLEHAADRLDGVAAGDREAELLVLVRGGDVLVGVRLDADGHPDHHRAARPAGSRGERGEPVDLVEGVDDDPADARPRARGAARRPTCCCRGSRSAAGRSRPAARRSARRRSRRRGRVPPRRPSGRPSVQRNALPA